jgi:uncharacterized FAD-dependent dehydrogenase
LVIEQGKAMRRRICPDSALCERRPCDVLEGEGGAGSFSDGKLLPGLVSTFASRASTAAARLSGDARIRGGQVLKQTGGQPRFWRQATCRACAVRGQAVRGQRG